MYVWFICRDVHDGSANLHGRDCGFVEGLAHVLQNYPQAPFAFYGHSVGALIAFELVRQLRRSQRSLPRHLFLSGCRSPRNVRSVPATFNLPTELFMAELRKLNGTPKEFFELPEIQAMLLPMLHADFVLTDTYEYVSEEPLNCPLTVYGGKADHLAPLESLCSWELETTGVCRTGVFTGDHFFVQGQKAEFLATFRQDVLETVDTSRLGGKAIERTCRASVNAIKIRNATLIQKR